MSSKSSQGFTLIEVVLAIAVGLIIIAGVSVGYSYAKRAAIMDNQRKDVSAIRSYVEQAIAAQQADPSAAMAAQQSAGFGSSELIPPVITANQLAALANSLPSLKTDPYNGIARTTGCNGSGSCFQTGNDGDGGNFSGGRTYTSGRIGELVSAANGSDVWTGNPGAGSGVVYVNDVSSYGCNYNVSLADGSQRQFKGWFVAESDADGNIIAAEGGTEGSSNGCD